METTENTRSRSISVVMCTYNGEKYLREQLDSILQQTYPILELIVQDDCSTDATCTIIEEYAAKHPFIKLYRNEHQLGINKNFFSALQRAQGDLIAISDQDDIWMLDKLERQIECIGQYDICASSYYVDAAYTDKMERVSHPSLSMERRFFENDIPGHTMLFRRSLLEKVQLPAPIFYDHWLVIWANLYNGIIAVDKPLNWHRPHSAAATHFIAKDHQPSNIFTPYLKGFTRWSKLQHTERWNNHYHCIEQQAQEDQKFAVIHKMSVLMQKKGIVNLFRIACLFVKYRNLFYPHAAKGLRSCIRAFCYPLMHAYYHYAEFTSWN